MRVASTYPRRWTILLVSICAGLLLWSAGCGQPSTPGSVPDPWQTLEKGVKFLLESQSADGAWRSKHYASFADGTALTPLVLLALQYVSDTNCQSPQVQKAIVSGLEFLSGFHTPTGEVAEPKEGFDYPVYTASLVLRVLNHATARPWAKQQAAWVRYLKDRQLTEKLGWLPEDKAYGGWGYCRVIPRKPEPDRFAPPLVESNLSATVFALDALASAQVLDESTRRAAAVFVRRCQNEDGGFHFIYDDPVRNKAGLASWQPMRYNSYGSATADGLRALVLCNWPEDKTRIQQAVSWLHRYCNLQSHPGQYNAAHEPQRNAVYYYYLASLVQTYSACPDVFEKPPFQQEAIATILAQHQREDGSWRNPLSLVREDEPLVATPLAIIALAHVLTKGEPLQQ